MCVIIYIPQGAEISEEEINAAWKTNPDGAGFSIRESNNNIFYHRGFMELEEYKEEILPLMGKHDMMLHFRISTSPKVNPLQTHAYELDNIEELCNETEKPVSSMNGICRHQVIDNKKYNDTMCYIENNNFLFKNIDKSRYWGDKITSNSGAKWCIMTPDNTYLSPQFEKVNGVYYSNTHHFWRVNEPTQEYEMKIGDILNERVIRNIKRNKIFMQKTQDYINKRCNKHCRKCNKCLYECDTLREINLKIRFD